MVRVRMLSATHKELKPACTPLLSFAPQPALADRPKGGPKGKKEMMAIDLASAFSTVVLGYVGYLVLRGVYNVFLHPLKRFPGPRAAGLTEWWKTWIEVFKGESFVHVLVKLHEEYGDIVRVGPNELHFSNADAYHNIYNTSLRWDKESKLYESFGEDHSSFGLVRYAESKQRKEVLQPLFSRRSVLASQLLVKDKVDHLVDVLSKNNANGKPSDLMFGFRCFTVDMITKFCFAESVKAMDEPNFAAPVVVAMDSSLPSFHLFHHFPWFRKTIFSLPPWLAIKVSPETAGLTHLQVILGKQVKEVSSNPSILEAAPHPTIYHNLLDPKVHKSNYLFTEQALFDEAKTMLFAGGVTVADTSTTGFFHILDQAALYSALRKEVFGAWPDVTVSPRIEDLEALPLLTATIKESLRLSPGVSSPLLRIVPAAGAKINNTFIPGSTIVGMSSFFVHQSSSIFPDPEKFNPYRWLDEKSSKDLEKWLVPFSKGPRSCVGLNLAWCELYYLYATLLRKFEMRLDGTTKEDLEWRDCFTPFYPGRHLSVFCERVRD